jgi:Fibronectin type III domain
MNKMLQSLLLLTLLSVFRPISLSAQDLMASSDKLSAAMLTTNTSSNNGEDNPKKKKKKNLPIPVPGCGEVNGFAQQDLQATLLKVKWQHEGDPNKVQYKLEWKNTITGQVVNSKIVSPTCSNCLMIETISGLSPTTTYTVSINAICNISVDGTTQFSTGAKTLLTMTTLAEPCSPVTNIISVKGFDYLSAEVAPDNTPNTNYIFTIYDNSTPIETHKQAASNGLYTFGGLQLCKNYSIEVSKECTAINVASAALNISATTKCCGLPTNITTSSPAAGTLKINWVNTPNENPEYISITVSTLAGVPVAEETISGSLTNFTFPNLPMGSYSVKMTAHCQCPNGGTGTCQVLGSELVFLADIADPCGIPAELITQSVKSNEVSFQWTQAASSKFRKYKLVLYNSKNTVVAEKEFNAATLASYTFTHTFTNIDDGQAYTAKLFTYCCADACCAADPFSTTCSWNPIADTKNQTFSTPTAICPAAINVLVSNSSATQCTVTWKSPDAVTRRYKVQLWKGLNKTNEVIVAGTASTMTSAFDNLEPNTEYSVKVIAECCFTATCSWKTGEEVSKEFRTPILTPASCNDKPTTFTLIPDKTSITIRWTAGNTNALSSSGRRFLLTYNGITTPIIIDDGTEYVVNNLEVNTVYDFSILEVFDGTGLQYGTACTPKVLNAKTLDDPNVCDNTFSAQVRCSDETTMTLSFVLKASQGNSVRVYYREVSSTLTQAGVSANNTCQNTASGIAIYPSFPNGTKPKDFTIEEINQGNIVTLKNLSSCTLYELEVHLIKTTEGVEKECKVIKFDEYFTTMPGGFTTRDDDKDGIPDNCDDDVKVSTPEVSSLPDTKCGDKVPTTVVDQIPLPDPKVGQIWLMNYIPLEVVTLNGAKGGPYSGTGFMGLPFQGKKVKVSFSDVKVNKSLMIYSGTVKGEKDDKMPQVAAIVSQINISNAQKQEKYCDLPLEEGYKNGVNSATGTPVGPNGFDSKGNYAANPLYPGYLPGAPFDPKFDPNGFGPDGKTKDGYDFNECGCNVKGLDEKGSACNKTKCPPYWWKQDDPKPSIGGLALFDAQNKDLKKDILEVLTKAKADYAAEQAKKEPECANLRTEMIATTNTLKYEELIVLGPNKDWINPGMNKMFARPPIPFSVNMTREPLQVALESKHILLYYCDVEVEKAKEYIKIIEELMKEPALTTLMDNVAYKMKRIPDAEAAEMKKDNTKYKNWLNVQMVELLAYQYKSKQASGTYVPSSKEDDTQMASVESIKAPAYYGSFVSDPVASKKLRETFLEHPEFEAQWQEKVMQFEYEQGLSQVGGISRGLILREIDKRRRIEQMLNPVGGATVVGMPIVLDKAVTGKNQTVYLDNLEVTPGGAKVDIFVVIETPKKQVVFEAKNIEFNKGGFTGAVNLGLGTDVSFPINNVAKFTLKGGGKTNVQIDCDGFKGMNLDLEIEFCRKYLIPLDKATLNVLPEPQKVKATLQTGTITSFNDIIVQNLSITPFEIAGYDGVKWELDQAVLDLSDLQTPDNIVFPTNYFTTAPTSGTNTPTGTNKPTVGWKGFYIKSIKVSLPEKLTKKIGGANPGPIQIKAENLIIDDGGVTVKVSVDANLLDINQGSLGGWAFSIDHFEVGIVKNKPTDGGFGGKIHIPITKKDINNYFTYKAAILPFNQYQFALSPVTNVEVEIWKAKATFESTSKVTIDYKNGEFITLAKLDGALEIDDKNGANSLAMKGLSFTGLELTNQKPYFKSAGTWSMPDVEAKMKGFAIKVSKIGLTKDVATNESYLNFNLDLELAKDESMYLKAGGGFSLVGEVNQAATGTQEYRFKAIKVHEIYVDGRVPSTSIKGKLSFFDADKNPKYGDGFFGFVDIDVEGLAAFKAVGTFGKKIENTQSYQYFLVDVLADLGKGVPIAPSINLTAVGGGVFWRMKKTTNKLDDYLPLGFNVNTATLGAGGTLTGDTYEPSLDPNSFFGVKLLTSISASGNEKAFNANASFGITFNNKLGISKVEFKGIAQFMKTPKKEASSNTAPPDGVTAALNMLYDVPAKTFQAKLSVSMSVAEGSVVGCEGGNCCSKIVGDAEIFISPSKWFVNIGRTNPTYDNYIAVGIGMPSNPSITYPPSGSCSSGKLLLSAYLCIGNSIPPMPKLPDYALKLVGDSYYPNDESSRATGKGFAFGANLSLKFDKKIGMLYADVEVGLGFDMMLMDYGNTTTCVNNQNKVIGMNGWYASGQSYARIYGGIGVVFKDKKWPIIAAGATVAMQTKGPNPFWAKGGVSVEYSLLGGIISGNEAFIFEIGKRCDIQGNGGPNGDEDTRIISSVTPENGTQKVSLRAVPLVEFNIPMNQEFGYQDDKGVTKAKSILSRCFVQCNGINFPVTAEYSSNNRSMKLVSSQMLPPNAKVEITTEVQIIKNGAVDKTESRVDRFETEEALTYIPQDNIAASYPADGQYNYYRNENNLHKGYIELIKSQHDLLANVPDGYEPKIRFSTEGKEVFSIPFTYEASKNRINFDAPDTQLEKGKVYLMELTHSPIGYVPPPANIAPSVTTGTAAAQGLSSSGGEDALALIKLYAAYFRVSIYEKVLEKLDKTNIVAENKGNYDYKVSFFNDEEPFDDYETGKVPGKAPLLAITDDLVNDNWYKNTVYQDLYSKYPTAYQVNTASSGVYYTVDLFSKKYGETNKVDAIDFFANVDSDDNQKIVANKDLYSNPKFLQINQFIKYNKFNIVYKDYEMANKTIDGIVSFVANSCANGGSSSNYGTASFYDKLAECKKSAKISYPAPTFPQVTVPQNINFTIMYKLPEATPLVTSGRKGSAVDFATWYSLMSSRSSTIFKKTVTRP